MTAPTRTSAHDQYAEEYAAYVATREQGRPGGRSVRHPGAAARAATGDVTGQECLDAGCGEVPLRILAARGARVTGVDLSPRLVALAGQKPAAGSITYLAADLCEPQPDLEGRFDAIASFFVLNDVEDHRGFAETLSRRSGRAAGPCSGSTTRTTTSCAGARLGLLHDRVGPTRVASHRSGCRCSSTIARCRNTWTPSGRRPAPDENRGRGSPYHGRAAGQRRGDPAGRAASALHGAGVREAVVRINIEVPQARALPGLNLAKVFSGKVRLL